MPIRPVWAVSVQIFIKKRLFWNTESKAADYRHFDKPGRLRGTGLSTGEPYFERHGNFIL